MLEPRFVERTTAECSTSFCVPCIESIDDSERADMNTLLNGSLHGEEAISPNAGVTPDIIPEAVNTQKGVSVRYVSTSANAWYVLRASYGREIKARDLLIGMDIYAYVVQRYEKKEVRGRKRKVLVSLLPNLVFAYMPKDKAENYVKGPTLLSSLISYYYNHFEQDEHDGEKNPPLIVSEKEMISFIRATSTNSEHLKVVDMDKCRFLSDNANKMVEVIRGDFQGVRGRIARVAGQQCIVVSIANGRWNISTEYIPTPYLRVID